MSVKTEEQIERDFYSLLNGSVLGKGIKGKVYRDEMRPNDAITEDLIVKFLTGLDSQVQTGIVILNIYIPDVKTKDGRDAVDHARVADIQQLVNDFIAEANDKQTEYWIETEATPTTMKNEANGQHLIYVRLNFSRITV